MKRYLSQKKAQLLEKQNKWAEAHDLYRDIADADGQVSPELAYRLGFTAVKNNAPETAIPWLLQAIKKEPVQANWCRYLAQVALRIDDSEAALAAFERAGNAAFNEASMHFALGQLLEQTKNFSEAARFYRQAVALDNSKSLYGYRLGRVLQQAEDYPAAIAAYQQALARDENNFDILLSLGRSAVEAGELTLIQSSYERILELEHEQAKRYHHVACYELGQLKAVQDDHTSALTYYQQALMLSPKHAASWHALGVSQQALQQPVEALESFKRAAQLKPESTEWQLTLAQYCGQSGPFAVAASAWAQALKTEPDNRDWLLQHALMLDMAGKIPEAQKTYARLLKLEEQDNEPDETEAPPHPLALYCEALALVHNKQHKDAQEPFAQALELMGEQAPAHWHFRYGAALFRGGRAADAEVPLQQAIRLLPGNHYYVYALAEAIRRQGRTWQEVEVLQQALDVLQAESNPNPNPGVQAKWCFELGEAQDKMNRFAEAGTAFAQANALKPHDAMQHFREGYAWERAGQASKAQAAYALAQQHDKKLNSKTFGIGVFHQARGYWPQAAEAYAQQSKNDPANGTLLYRLGMAHDRCYRWDQAAQYYRQALVFEPHKPDWHYRLGFVLERQEQWQEAARYYRFAAATRDKHTPYWFYRLGYVLNKAGEQEKACRAFLQTRTQIELPPQQAVANFIPADLAEDELQAFATDYSQQQNDTLQQLIASDMPLHSNNQAQAYYTLGQQAERREMWQEAAELYQQAVRRSNEHKIEMYYRLGYALTQLGKLAEACTAFVNTRIFQQPHGVDMSRYEKNAGLIQTMEYTEFLETLPIEKNTIVYESFLGASLSCNPYAMYLHLVDNPAYKHFTHIWIVTDATKLPFDYQPRSNTILIKRQSAAYRRYLATAEYLINNVTFPFWFIRREGQKYLNTWHGTPLKGLGKDMPGEFYVHGNVSRNFLHATHLLSPNRHTSDVMMKSYDIAGIYGGLLAETGYPRVDLTLNATDEQKAALKKHLGLNSDKPVVVYAPTWRGLQSTVETDVDRILNDLAELAGDDYQLVFRGHHFAEAALQEADIPVLVADQSVDANLLLAITDVLITDYSSIFFDFLVTKKPIIYYTYDLEEYSQIRGLYFQYESLPGTVCAEVLEVRGALKKYLDGSLIFNKDENITSTINQFAVNDNGQAADKAIQYFTGGSMEYVTERYVEQRDVALFFNGPFIPNGITTSFLNLINNIPQERLLIALALNAADTATEEERIEKFNMLPKEIQVLPKVGSANRTPEEAWCAANYTAAFGYVEPEVFERVKKMYGREYVRLYGLDNKIKYTLNFEGYSAEWVQIFSQSRPAEKKITWLHSDLKSEHEVRLPYLTRNFFALSEFDLLVSVSEMMSDVNKSSLHKEFVINEEKFTYCENTINSKEIFVNSTEVLDEDLKPWFGGQHTFLTMGRMSPEKDHQKLVKAFAQVNKFYPDSKLVILGDGPLREQLEKLIEDLELNNNVFLAGQRVNPFPALKACSCFVLPSNHEGQSMVLLEAMVLNKPIIATDIDGNRGALIKYNGTLVENSTEGLVSGLGAFIEGKVLPCEFDVRTYEEQSIGHFLQLLENGK